MRARELVLWLFRDHPQRLSPVGIAVFEHAGAEKSDVHLARENARHDRFRRKVVMADGCEERVRIMSRGRNFAHSELVGEEHVRPPRRETFSLQVFSGLQITAVCARR